MRAVVTLVSPSPSALADAVEAVVSHAPPVKARDVADETAADLIIETDDLETLSKAVGAAVAPLPVDACVQALEGRAKRLLIADMDSTIISCECLDELADYAGVKAEIAEVTERAMRGELDFEPALRARVARLAGLPLSALQRCYDERVRLNPGARTLIRTMAAHGARCVLVSGGFEFFTSRVAELAGFHDNRGNTLIDDGERLTGEVGDPILGREAKLGANALVGIFGHGLRHLDGKAVQVEIILIAIGRKPFARHLGCLLPDRHHLEADNVALRIVNVTEKIGDTFAIVLGLPRQVEAAYFGRAILGEQN